MAAGAPAAMDLMDGERALRGSRPGMGAAGRGRPEAARWPALKW
jgi:hypothetical protein